MAGKDSLNKSRVELKDGKQMFSITLADSVPVLETREPLFEVDESRFEKAFFPALPENADSFKSIAIVVADKTRRCEYDIYLPKLLKMLLQQGITQDQITFFIAYGTHARQTDAQCLDVYGDVFREYRFVHHDSSDVSLFADCGVTKKGTRIRIRKDILQSDLVISFGALSHHYFAGYGGGRKLLFPGLGYTPDIYQNHSLFLDKKNCRLSFGCCPGELENNPLARDLEEIDGYIQSHRISIHGILDSSARVCQLIVGKTWQDFTDACQTLDSFYRFKSPRKYGLVLASCGGYPRDINFIQAHKAVNNAAMFVKDGGILAVLAQCPDGIGSQTFLEYFDYADFHAAFDVLEKEYRGNGGTALSMMTKTARINIFLKTDLDDTICKAMGTGKIEEKAIAALVEKFENDMACIKNASLLTG
ncbi:MAG: DUF2088 domain-containing protein [Proteobacteria bacterium]|nr:DUF2088 domain-containing protein [Pseudomonadota bacterium]